jgi:hypothetical protein
MAVGHARLGGDQRGGGGSSRSTSVAWRAQTRAVESGQRGAASHNGSRWCARRGGGRLSGRWRGRDARSADAFMVWHARARGMCQPCGESALIDGPGAGSGG